MHLLKKLIVLSLFAPGLVLAATELSIGTKGEELKYDKETLSVKAGEEVKLTFTNDSKSMPHNWVLLKKGSDPVAVGNKGIQAGMDKGFIPPTDDVLEHTKLLKGGEKQTITFKAPSEPGDYPFVCTFPGHPATMKGILKVTAK